MALRDETKYTMKSLWDRLLPDLDLYKDLWFRLDNSEDYAVEFEMVGLWATGPRARRMSGRLASTMSALVFASNPLFTYLKQRDKQKDKKSGKPKR